MKTLYIDVYFLINFTVDLIAIYLSAEIVKVKSSIPRLLCAAALGSLFACAVTLLALRGIAFFAMLILAALLTVIIFAPHTTAIRRIKLSGAFLIIETLLGGMVYWLYGVLDRHLYPLIVGEEIGAENRTMLSLSLIIILSYGLIRLIFLSLSGSADERNVELIISFFGKAVKVTALTDSGNLAIDPMTLKPVVFIKSDACVWLGKDNDILESKDPEIQKRIRIIPIKGIGGSRLLTALRCDYIEIIGKGQRIKDVVVAIDDEEGSYGGYVALVPLSFVTNT